jgi:hypothetical protein
MSSPHNLEVAWREDGVRVIEIPSSDRPRYRVLRSDGRELSGPEIYSLDFALIRADMVIDVPTNVRRQRH